MGAIGGANKGEAGESFRASPPLGAKSGVSQHFIVTCLNHY